ncbi:MAG: HTH-type transcriptional regulator BhcR [Pseudomonadota bacterium]
MDDTTPRKRARGRPRSASAEAPASTVQALDRSILLLRALAKEGRATLSELALTVGMPASSAHRLLVTLDTHRLVDFNERTQEWMIGVEAFRIGSAFLQRDNLVEIARDVLTRLVEETGETANLGIADQGEVVFLSQVDTQNPIRAFFRAGTRVPMHSSGIGKALMAALDRPRVETILQSHGLPAFTDKTLAKPDALFADLERTRARGWAFDDEERFAGMRCVAAPVFNAHGEAVAGVSISGPSIRFDEHSVAEKGARVRRAADELTELTGGDRPI